MGLKDEVGTKIQDEGIVTQGSRWEKEIKSEASVSQMDLAQISKASIQKVDDYVASILVSTMVGLSLRTPLSGCLVGTLGAYPKIMMNGSLSFHKWDPGGNIQEDNMPLFTRNGSKLQMGSQCI